MLKRFEEEDGNLDGADAEDDENADTDEIAQRLAGVDIGVSQSRQYNDQMH